MQVLICHSSQTAVSRLRSQLLASTEISTCVTAISLTDTYNFAEHRHPDCVVLAAELADHDEFELLDTLFRIIGIGCVLVHDGHYGNTRQLSAQAKKHVVIVSDQLGPLALLEAVQLASQQASGVSASAQHSNQSAAYDPKKIVLIGASTGGIDALIKTTQGFSTRCPPTVIVQHTGGRFAKSLIRLLDRASQAQVIEAQDGALLQAGHIYLPPGDAKHLRLETTGTPKVSLQDGEPISGHRPSIDALFTSALPYAEHVTAALMTGMGRDGAQGLTALRQAGAQTIGQDQATSVVYGMPRVAKEMGGVAQELPLEKIGPALLTASSMKSRV